MKKEFLVNIILLVIINVIVKLSYLFFIEVEIQNTIGPDQYGLFLALFNFSYLLQFINDPGLQSFNSTYVASRKSENTDHFSKIIGLKLVLSSVFIIAVLCGALIVGYDSQELKLLLVLIAINQVLSTAFMFFRSNLSALGYYRFDTYLSALDKLLMIMILGYFLIRYDDSLTVFHFVSGQMIAYILACMISILLLAGKGVNIMPAFSFSYSKTILKGAAPYALILFLMASYNKMDGVMIERILDDGAYQAGIYAASLRYMDAANMGAYLMAALLLPMFASQHKNIVALRELSGLAIRLMSVMVGVICIIGITYRNELMGIYEAFDAQYNNLLILHLLSFACVGVSYVYGTLLTATMKLQSMNYILLGGLLINLVLNLVLIPRLYAEGAAIATFSTQAFVMTGQAILSVKIFKLRVKLGQVLRLILFVLISCFLVGQIYNLVGKEWISGVIISLVITSIMSFLLGIVRKDMIFAVIK